MSDPLDRIPELICSHCEEPCEVLGSSEPHVHGGYRLHYESKCCEEPIVDASGERLSNSEIMSALREMEELSE